MLWPHPNFCDHECYEKVKIDPNDGDIECTYRYMINMLIIAIKEETVRNYPEMGFILSAANVVRIGADMTDNYYNKISELYEKYITEKDGY